MPTYSLKGGNKWVSILTCLVHAKYTVTGRAQGTQTLLGYELITQMSVGESGPCTMSSSMLLRITSMSSCPSPLYTNWTNHCTFCSSFCEIRLHVESMLSSTPVHDASIAAANMLTKIVFQKLLGVEINISWLSVSHPFRSRIIWCALANAPGGSALALARLMVWWPRMVAQLVEFIDSCPTCQRVKAEHGLPAGLLYLLPVPVRRGGMISLDFLELSPAKSSHDFMQVHIDLLTGRVWLVPTFKSSTAEAAARNFIGSVFRDVGLPDTIVSDRDCWLTAEFWTALHRAFGSTLIFGSPDHHNTSSKVERVNWVVADLLRAFANDRQDDWPLLTPLVEFAINDVASPLCTGFTPFYAFHGQHPRRPLTRRRRAVRRKPGAGRRWLG